MSDDPDAPRCSKIICTLNALGEKEEAYVVLRSRLWNSTYIEVRKNSLRLVESLGKHFCSIKDTIKGFCFNLQYKNGEKQTNKT